MYIRRKVFSILTDEVGDERLFSVNETLIQKEFGAHKRKQNRKAANNARYVEINANKAAKAKERAAKELAKGNIEAAEKAIEKASRHATQSSASASQLSEITDKIGKTRKSVDSQKGLTIKRDNAIHNQELNLKRDIPNNQTTATRTVTSKHDVIPGTNKKVTRRTTTIIERDIDKPKSTANPINNTTNASAKATRQARKAKGVPSVQVTQEITGYRGGVNNKPVVEYEATKTLEKTKDGIAKIAENIEKVKKGSVFNGSFNPMKWSKNAKIGGGIALGATALGTGAYLYNKSKKKD